MSKEYYKKCIADKRVEIVKLRAKMTDVKEQKAKKMKDLAGRIRTTTSKSTKEAYRKQKISEAARYSKEVDSLKNKIEQVKKQIENYRKQLASLKK